MRSPVLAMVVLLLASGPAIARQSSSDRAAAYARLDTLGFYSTASIWCEKLGYRIDQSRFDQIDGLAIKEAVANGMSPDEAKMALSAAVNRHVNQMQTELDRVVASLDGATKFRPPLVALVDRFGKHCDDIAADPIFRLIVTAPSPAVRAKVRTEFLDSMVEMNGEASWQTHAIVMQGELLQDAGVCRTYLGSTELAALTVPYIGLPEPAEPGQVRERRYYAKMYTSGIDMGPELALDETQCQRLLATGRRHVKEATSPSPGRPAARTPGGSARRRG